MISGAGNRAGGYERNYGTRKFRISPFASEQMEAKEKDINEEIEMPYVAENEREDVKNDEGDYEPMYPLEQIIPVIPETVPKEEEKPMVQEREEVKSELWLMEKLGALAQEKRAERALGAKGIGAFGKFTASECMRDYTMADFLSEKGKETSVYVRFAPMFQSRGGADTARDVRMMEIKLDTKDGIYDILALSTPVFFIRDGEKLTELVHATSPSGKNGIRDSERLMALAADTPEMTQALMRLYSNEGTQKSYIKMNGYTPNTYVWVNGDGKVHYARYVIEPRAGYESISAEDAQFYAGQDPDIAMRELTTHLENGKSAAYDMYVQLISPEKAMGLDFNVTDATRSWGEVELIPMGVLTLEQSIDDYYTDAEQAAFSPSNTVKGIELSSDKLLSALSFFMPDADRYRLGANYGEFDINKSSFGCKNCILPRVMGEISGKKSDDFTEAQTFYRSLSPLEREQMTYNLANAMKNCDTAVGERLIELFTNVDDDFGNSVNVAWDSIK